MKKFYYKKGETSLDKTPIILRLDRRHTVDRDGVREETSRYSRATSISSLDQLKDIPTLPRARTRAVTKSLSEDFLSSGNYVTPSTVIITETELSSSWLYKNMKAVNSEDEDENDSENTSRTSMSQPNFSPVRLQDPKMKPVPVPTTPRPEKTSSYLCNMVIMIVISLCTIGFISTIGGIIYLEVFANRNIAENPTAATSLDGSDILNQVKFEDQESTEHSYKAEVNKDLDHDSSKLPGSKEVGASNELEDKQRNTVRILDFSKEPETELTQFIDNIKTEIKHKKDSVIFKEKSSSVDKERYVVAAHIEDNQINISNIESNLNEIIINSNQSENNVTEVDVHLDGTSKEFERYLPPRFNQSINFISKDEIIESLQEVNNLNIEDSVLKSNTGSVLENVSMESDHKQDALKDETGKDPGIENNQNYKNELNRAEITMDKSEKYIPKISEFPSKVIVEENEPENQMAVVETGENANHLIESRNENESMETLLDENIDSLESEKIELNFTVKDMDIRVDENKEDGESTTTAIVEPSNDISSKEPEEFSKRNGDISLASLKNFKIPSKSELIRPVLPSPDFSRIFQQKIPQATGKKPVDIKVSLAEAIKHLQVLDVNNKIPSSRKKVAKPKVKTTQRPRTTLKSRKEEEAMEQLRYLQKLRLLLYDQMGRN